MASGPRCCDFTRPRPLSARDTSDDEGIRGSDAFTALADRGQSLNTVHRFRVQFLRAFHRTINELTKLQNKTPAAYRQSVFICVHRRPNSGAAACHGVLQ